MGRQGMIRAALLLTALAAGWWATGTAAMGHTAAGTGFSPNVTNPWFPLRPGTTLVYRGTKDDQPARDVFRVTHETVLIGRVRCQVVADQLFLGGVLEETTRDYYTQDRHGNVWYYGEDTAELDAHGNVVSTEGSWHAGVSGALPGIFMPATPRVGASFRQEFLAGQAEDHFQILDLHASVTVPFRSFPRAMLTKEWTPLEPGVLDHKYYARGIGTVKELSVKGPVEILSLVEVRHS
jgi:hypothetical protein